MKPSSHLKTALGLALATLAMPGLAQTAIRDVRVFDGENVLERATVVWADGYIQSVAEHAVIPPGYSIIDGQGKTLLPALIDAHTHNYGDAERDALRFGVATELELMGHAVRLPDYKAQRADISQHTRADVWSSGAALTAPHGHGTQFGFPVPVLAAGDDVAGFVAARVGEGSDVVKLIVEDMHTFASPVRLPTLNAQQVAEGIAAAKAQGRLAIVHVSAEADALTALKAGASGLAHVFVDRIASDALLAAARAADAFVIPTLSVLASVQGSDEGVALAQVPHFAARLSAAQRSQLQARYPRRAGLPDNLLANAKASVRRLHQAGVAILAGTDAGNPGTAHGVSMHGEMALLVQAGLSPQQALRAATSLPAARLGMRDRGRIAPGLRADLLLVEGAPDRQIEDTRRIVAVWKNGHEVNMAAAAATQASAGVISDFERDTGSRFGSGWLAGSDRMMGGQSDATAEWRADGANGSRGALRVSGEVRQGFAYPWAGVSFLPGDAAMTAVDLRAFRAISFKIRGTPGNYAFTVLGSSAQPAFVPLAVGEAWREVRLKWADLPAADWQAVRMLGISRASPGAFWFELDDVVLE